MRLFDMKGFVRGVSAVMLCAMIGTSLAAAYNAADDVLATMPAADTNTAAIGMISTADIASVGSVGTTEEMSRVKAEVEAQKAAEEAARKAAEAAAKEAARKAALVYKPTYGRTVSRSSNYAVTETIQVNGKAKGNFKLTFYCADAACSGPYGNNTATGNKTIEGRTIAVDPRVIPLGSKVYIEGYGDFIAEDTGGAIKGNKIDVYLTDHSRVVASGVAHADVYVMN